MTELTENQFLALWSIFGDLIYREKRLDENWKAAREDAKKKADKVVMEVLDKNGTKTKT